MVLCPAVHIWALKSIDFHLIEWEIPKSYPHYYIVTLRTFIFSRDVLSWLINPKPKGPVETHFSLDVIYGLSDFTIDSFSMRKKEMEIELGLTFAQIRVKFLLKDTVVAENKYPLIL